MRYGKAVAARMVLLAALAASIGGCNTDAAPRQVAAGMARYPVPEVRYQVDTKRNRVWFLSRDGVFLYTVSRPERVAVALPAWVWAGAPYGCLPDLALGPKGEAVVTSDVLPTLWRVDPDTLAASVHPLALDVDSNREAGFSGLVYSARQNAFFATSYQDGSLWRIDPALTRAQKVSLSERIPGACGLALARRGAHLAGGGPTDLCVRTPHGGWSVVFAPDWRSAYVSAAPCTDQVSASTVASLRGR